MAEKRPVRRRARRRRRRRADPQQQVLKLLVSVLLILLLVAGGLFAFIQIKLGQIGKIGPIVFTSEDFDDDTDEADTIGAVDWGDAGIATSVDGVVNILLVGQDTRIEGERARSDSMIVLSINKNTEQMNMISLMRDIYVQIPGYSDNKLNAAYQFGGFELLDQTIESNFGINVDYNVEVDFSGFKNIIDTVGGVDVTLRQEEVDHFLIKHPKWTNLHEGMCHLNGKQALAYARLRKVGNSDFERTERQRTIIQATYAKMRTENWTNLLNVYDACAESIFTDMNPTQMMSIAFSAYNMGLDHINSYRVPANDTFTDEVVRRMQILVPKDWNQTRVDVWSYLYGDPEESAEDNQAQAELENIKKSAA